MFCPNCGNQIPDGAKFCNRCGAAAEYVPEAPGAAETPLAGAGTPETDDVLERPTPNIQLCSDGVYRWFYPFDMLKNPNILFTVWNVEAIAFGAIYLLVLLINLIGDSLYGMEGFLELTKGFAIMLLVFLVIGVIAYLILAAMFGWRYLVIFEMDEKGVLHKQMPPQFEKVEAITWIGLLAARTPATAGAALLAGSKSESYVSFDKLRKVLVQRRRHTIKVNERLEHSQVYAAPEDFDFVLNYILAHTPDTVKVSGR